MSALDRLRAFIADCDWRRVPDNTLVAEQVWSDSEPTIGELRALLKEREWQPIETAPKNEPVLLDWRPFFPFAVVGYFRVETAQWCITPTIPGFHEIHQGKPDNGPTHWQPLPSLLTHWRQLPEPPKASGSDS